MDWQHAQTAAPYLLIIGYLLVASVLKATAGHVRKHISRHDRVRAAKIRRLQYMREIQAYRARLLAAATDAGNVEIVEGDEPEAVAEPAPLRRAA